MEIYSEGVHYGDLIGQRAWLSNNKVDQRGERISVYICVCVCELGGKRKGELRGERERETHRQRLRTSPPQFGQ